MRARLRSESGMALIVVLLMLGVMTMIGMAITGVGMIATTVTVNATETASALAIADGGLAHARRMILWQEWPAINTLLQNGNGVACSGDELATVPAGAPAGFPSAASDLIPAAGRAFGGGTYQVYVCDDHATDVHPTTGVLDGNANSDVNRRIIVRAVGTTATGASATVEQIYSSSDVPALTLNGNVLVTGNIQVLGTGGAVQSNGTLELAGNACAQVSFSAASTLTVSGASVGGSAACTAAALQAISEAAPVNAPALSADAYKAQADVWLNADGTCYSTLLSINVPCLLIGWSYNAGTSTWSDSGTAIAATYWADGNVDLDGTYGTILAPAALTILAKGHVRISGSHRTQPDLSVSGIGINNVGLSIVAGTDVQVVGNNVGLVGGVVYAPHQVDITGSSSITGQVVALNQADTNYPAAGGTNLVARAADGRMQISGAATITFNGTGMRSLRAAQWRECRTSNDPANPCGTLYGG